MGNDLDSQEAIDVAIIGGGPAGLSAAIALKKRKLSRVVVLEREPAAGGIPRHCGHPPFGMREFKRLLTGPQYARKLVAQARKASVEIHTGTSVIEARPEGILLIATQQGTAIISARRVIYATGVRETPRSARLISGKRPLGIINTGALQSMIYLHKQKPFMRPLIVGSELVSFSAILTCRHARIKPVAMIEENPLVTARWPTPLFPALVRVPLHLGTRLIAIEGGERVSGVAVEDARGDRRTIECDGVILTGQFVPESSLARCGHLSVDPATGGPVVDQYGRCSDPVYFAAGNVLRPVETAGWSWREGEKIAGWVADDLAGDLPNRPQKIKITLNGPLLKYAMPQVLAMPLTEAGMQNLQLRVNRRAAGTLRISNAEGVLFRKTMRVKPEHRILVPIGAITGKALSTDIVLNFVEH